MFVEIHSLHTYVGALLNRGRDGEAKSLPVGGVRRTMISSQCRKRHWRMDRGEFAIANIPGAEDAVRSRNLIPELVMPELRDQAAATPETLDAIEAQFNVQVYGKEGTQERHRQCLLMGLPEINFLKTKAREVCAAHPDDPEEATLAVERLFDRRTDSGRNFQAMLQAIPLRGGLISSMFGRMNTADEDANMEAAVSVNHAFTVHGEESVHDFFTAVDDLSSGRGAAMLNHSELNSGVYYGYVAVDVKQHVANTQACEPQDWLKASREMTAQTVKHLTHLIATVSPGAKRGSTAPYSTANLMLTEIGSGQPRNLAHAFHTPTQPSIEAAYAALAEHMTGEDRMTGNKRARMFASTHRPRFPAARQATLDELAEWTAEAVRSGTVPPVNG